MAKRKRLAPAQPRDLDQMPLERKSMGGLSPHPAPPISQVAGEASAAAALEEVSETLRRARAEGRMITMIPLDQIDEAYLVRDRIPVDDEDMATLRTSLETRGQKTPIELVELGPDHYGLISGWRRCQALRSIGAEAARAIITPPGEAPDIYAAMVEENEIRVGLSYFERARIVIKAVEAGVFETQKQALNVLFGSASRAKRSKVKSFIPVVEALGDMLRHPTQVGERLGLRLSKALGTDPVAATQLREDLGAARRGGIDDEQATLLQSLKRLSESKSSATPAAKPAINRHRVSPVPGVVVSTKAQAITLEGRRVDPDLYNALLLWLKQRG